QQPWPFVDHEQVRPVDDLGEGASLLGSQVAKQEDEPGILGDDRDKAGASCGLGSRAWRWKVRVWAMVMPSRQSAGPAAVAAARARPLPTLRPLPPRSRAPARPFSGRAPHGGSC